MEPAARQTSPFRPGSLFPREHGAWGAVFEPLVLGLVAAPAVSSALLATAVAAAFLARQPLELLAAAKGRRPTAPAVAFLTLSVVGLVAFSGACAAGSPGLPFVMALAIAAALAAVNLWLAVGLRRRARAAVWCGSLAPQFIAPAMILLASPAARVPAALALCLLLGRQATTITYVRFRLDSARGRSVSAAPTAACHSVLVVVAMVLPGAGIAGWPAPAAAIMLGLRALWGWRRSRAPVRPIVIGLSEAVYGLAYAILAAFSLG